MRRLAVIAAFLAILLAGYGAHTATQSAGPEKTTADTVTRSTQPEETTADTATGSTQSETTAGTTAGTAAVPEKTATATDAPAGWVTAIGDSVMLGAVDALLQEVPNLSLIDAQGSRQFPAAIDILRQRGAAGQLGDGVIVHIGNNGPFTAEQFYEMMRMLASVRKVLIVNLTVPPDVEDPIAVPNNAMLAAGTQRFPNAVLVDWHAASAGHPEYFGEDGIHLSLQGAQAYADLISAYLGGPEEGSVVPSGSQERTYWGEGGTFGECVGPPSWCAITLTP
jgi:hypothetical protein